MRMTPRVAALALVASLSGCSRTPEVAPPPAASRDSATSSKPTETRPEAPAPAPVAEVPPFAFPQDEFGPMLQERLASAVPTMQPDPSPTEALRERAMQPRGLDRIEVRPLPSAIPEAAPTPRLLASDRVRPARPRPSAELPRWDVDLRMAGPARPPLPVTPRASVASPDPNRVPIALIVPQSAPTRPAVTDDSTLERSREATLASEFPLRIAPTNSARVSLPNPDETLHNAAVQAPPPDDDPPAVASRALPTRPPLPTTP